MTTLDGFDIETYTIDSFLFRRVCEPQHEYVVRVTSERIEVREIWPADVECRNPDLDAIRFKADVLKTAKTYQAQLFRKIHPVSD